jgi:hypothetical protein
LGAKTLIFGRLRAPAVLISARWRYGQRWIRRRRIISESLRTIGRKLSCAFTKYGKANFQNLVGRRNRLFFWETFTIIYDSMQLG